MKINWSSIGAAFVTGLGIASSPAVMGMLPPKAAATIAGIGLILQAFSHPVATTTTATAGATPPATGS